MPSYDLTGTARRAVHSSLHLGRVDVFLAAEFHGGPFQEREERNGSTIRDVHGVAGAVSASQTGCDTSLTTGISLASAERGTIGSGGDGYIVGGAGRPWFSRRVLTAG